MASSQAELHSFLDKLDNVSQQFGLLINVDKTKVMTLNGSSCVTTVQGTNLEQVSSFPCLSSVISEDARYEKKLEQG